VAITIPILTDFDGRGINKATRQFGQLETKGQKASFAIRKAAIPAGIALAAVGAAILGGTKAAIEDQKSSEQLARTIGKVTNATKSQVTGLEDYITKTERATNVTDMELRPALAVLATATGSLEKGQKGLALALDVAAGTGKPLAQVSEALSKAYAGNLRGLNSLDPRMKTLIKNGATADEAMQVLAKTFKGDAAAATKTAEGRMKGMSIAISEAQENIGHALLPAIEKVLPVILKFTRFLQDNPKVVIIAAGAIAALATGILVLNVAMMLIAANPIALILAGIAVAVAALAVGIVVLYRRSETFRKIVTGAFEGAKKVIEVVVDFLKGPVLAAWETIKGILEVIKGLISGDFTRVWEGIKTTIGGVLEGIKTSILGVPLAIGGAVLDIGKTIVTKIAEGVSDLASKVWDKIKGLPQSLKNLAVAWVEGLVELGGRIITYMVRGVTGLGEKVWDHISGIPEFLEKKISNIASGMKEIGGTIVGFIAGGITAAASGIAGGLKTMLNAVIKVVNKAIAGINKIRGAVNKLPGVNIPEIPRITPLAKGGIVTQPTLALVGEAGPEAVIPLNRAHGFGQGITINIDAGLVSTPDQIGQQIIEAIQIAQRRSGTVFAAA
jgi:phage-related protein